MPIQVRAENAVGGHRYLTQTGVTLEVAPMSARDPRPRRDSHGNIHVWVVKADGETDKSRLVQVPMAYVFDDPDPQPRKPGRRPHADKTWRGWAFNHKAIMDAIVEDVVGQGCYKVAATNYTTFGWGGHKLLVVFRSGALGFSKLPKYFIAFPNKRVRGRFSPARVDVRKAVAEGLRVELLRALRQYIADAKGEVLS